MKKTIKLFTLITLLLLNSNIVFANENVPLNQQNLIFKEKELTEADLVEKLDLISGNINISFDIDKESLESSTNFLIKNTNKKEINQISFVLNNGLNIEDIEIKNSKIKEIIKEKANGNDPLMYIVFLEKPILANESTSIKINYNGKISSNYKFGRIKENDIFLTSQTFFYPRFEKLEQSSSNISLNVKVPDSYTVISQSEDFSIKKEANKSVFTSNVRNINGLRNDNGFNLASAKYNVYKSDNLDIYYRDKFDKSILEYIKNFETQALSTLTKIFGKHDYKKFNIVEVNRDDLGGMAASNVIFLSDKNFGNYINKSKLQYDYFKKLYNDENKVNDEYKYYLRNVLAHESSHLFFNYFYTYDKPWFAEGFPEFISLKILEEFGEQGDLKRKLKEYEINLSGIKDNKFSSLNNANLFSPKGYAVNYWGTPLVLYKLWETQGNKFWNNLDNLLKNSHKSKKINLITYYDFKKNFYLDDETANIFEKEYKLKK